MIGPLDSQELYSWPDFKALAHKRWDEPLDCRLPCPSASTPGISSESKWIAVAHSYEVKANRHEEIKDVSGSHEVA